MELRRYVEIAWRRKWLILLTFLITMGATATLVLPKPWIYESTATWLIRSRLPVTNGDTIDATDVLNRTVNLAASFATVARSDRIKADAVEQLGTDVDVSGTQVNAEIITSTTILSIVVSGPHPQVNAALAQAVGDRTTAFIYSLGTPFVLTPVDEPEASKTPVAPNKTLTIAMGGLLGLALGMAFALFAEYLRRGREAEEAAEIGRPEPMIREWLRWQRVEADRTRRPFSIGLIRVLMAPSDDDGSAGTPPDPEHVRRIKGLLRLSVPSDVAIAYVGDGDFAMVLPATELILARDLVERVRAGLALLLDPAWADIAAYLSSGTCEYDNRRLEGDAWVVRAVRDILGGDGSSDRPEREGRDIGSPIFDGVDGLTLDAQVPAARSDPSPASGRTRS
jgi:capsular polysaccharide biosynthesis protein